MFRIKLHRNTDACQCKMYIATLIAHKMWKKRLNDCSDTYSSNQTERVVSLSTMEGNEQRDKKNKRNRDHSNSEDLYKNDHVTKGDDGDGKEGHLSDEDNNTTSAEDEMYDTVITPSAETPIDTKLENESNGNVVDTKGDLPTTDTDGLNQQNMTPYI